MFHIRQNRSAAIALRWSFTAFALCAFVSSTPAGAVQTDKPTSITGVYNGTYAGAQGTTKFKLSITQQDNGILAGECTLYVPEGSGTNEYTYEVRGRYIAVN